MIDMTSYQEALNTWADVLAAIDAHDKERVALMTAYDIASFTVQEEERELSEIQEDER